MKTKACSLFVAVLAALVVASAGSATAAKPKITSFSPATGAVGTSVKIKGKNLSGATAVKFNGTPAQSFSVDSTTQITAAVAAGSTTGKVSVTTPGGTATSSDKFKITGPPGPPPAPQITSFSPTTSAAFAPVLINGSGLTGATAVSFNGRPALNYTVVSDSQIKAWLASGTTSGKIGVVTPRGAATSASPLTVAFLIELSRCQQQPGTTYGILPGAPIWFGTAWSMTDSSFLAQFLANTKTTLTVDGTKVKSAGSFWDSTGLPGGSGGWVTRFNYDPKVTATKVGDTLSVSFQVVATKTLEDGFDTYPAGTKLWPDNPCNLVGMPLAKFDSFSPASGPPGTLVSILGDDLGWVNGVRFGNAAAEVIHVNQYTLNTRVPEGASSGRITLLQGPQVSIPSPSDFTVIPSAPMVVTSFSPDRGLPGITTIRIQGSGFYRVTSVKFGGVAANILLPPYSDTDMVVTVPDGAHTGPITLSDGTNTIATDTFSVIRPAGELDRDFGTSGVTTIDADPARTEQLTAMTVDGDGRIVAAGRFTSGNPPYPSDTGPILVRLNADGTPDTSFGTSGVVVANLASAPYFKARSVTAMADGKILVGGTVDWNGTDGGDRLGVIRFLADGSVDTSFGTDGVAIKKVFVNGGNCGLGTVVMTVTPDGRIAMLGDPCHDAALVVFLADGTLDPSFGDGGVAVLPTTYDTGPRVVLAQPDGKLVAAGPLSGVTAGGSPWHAIVIARVDAEGSLDPSFGTNGLATHTSHGVQLPYFGAVLPDGHIVLAGAADGPFGFEAVRLDTNGTPDPSFGTAGWGFIGPQDNVFSHAAAVEPDGRVDVAGGRFVGRFTPDGFPDTTFGTNGVAPRGPAAWSVGALQPGSGFVVGGAVNADKSLIARYTTEPPVVP